MASQPFWHGVSERPSRISAESRIPTVRDALEIPRGTATTTLTRRHDEGYVGTTEDGYYHALDEREDLRRYVASLEQAHRLFGDHRDADATPEEPDERIGKGRTDRDLKREVEELEDKVGDMGG